MNKAYFHTSMYNSISKYNMIKSCFVRLSMSLLSAFESKLLWGHHWAHHSATCSSLMNSPVIPSAGSLVSIVAFLAPSLGCLPHRQSAHECRVLSAPWPGVTAHIRTAPPGAAAVDSQSGLLTRKQLGVRYQTQLAHSIIRFAKPLLPMAARAHSLLESGCESIELRPV